MTTVAHPPTKGYRTIRVPLAEPEYERFLSDRTYAKAPHSTEFSGGTPSLSQYA